MIILDTHILIWMYLDSGRIPPKILSPIPKMRLVPISPEIAVRSATLAVHGDPADRLIAASALVLQCPLATVDGKLLVMPEILTFK